MRVTIKDHYLNEEEFVYEGDPLTVEQELRRDWAGNIRHIPHGDLRDIVRTLKRMSGLDVKVAGLEEVPIFKSRKQPVTEARVDPWIRESDLP